jgi:hypothetical protein
LNDYQKIKDENLITAAKNIIGAINEVKLDATYLANHKVDKWTYDGYLGTLLVHNNQDIIKVNMASTYAPFTLAYRDEYGCTQVASPRLETDAANKGYVDSVSGLYNHSIRIAVAFKGKVGIVSADFVDSYNKSFTRTTYYNKYSEIYKPCIVTVSTADCYEMYSGDFTIVQDADGFFKVQLRLNGGSIENGLTLYAGQFAIDTANGDFYDKITKV